MVTNGSEGVKDKADGGGSVFFLDSPSHPNIRSHSSSKIKAKVRRCRVNGRKAWS